VRQDFDADVTRQGAETIDAIMRWNSRQNFERKGWRLSRLLFDIWEAVEVCFAKLPGEVALVGMVNLSADFQIAQPERVSHPVCVMFAEPLYQVVQVGLVVWQVGSVPPVGRHFSIVCFVWG